MAKCPQCGQELVPDPNNPGKVLCYNCKKRYSEDAIAAHWAKQNAANPQFGAVPPMTNTVPQQGYNAPQQGYNTIEAGAPMTIGGGQVPPQAPMNGAAPMPQYPNGTQYPVFPQPLPKGMAIAALIFAIIALMGFWLPVINIGSIVLGIVALILGIIAMRKASRGLAGGKGMSIAAIVISALTIISSIGITACTLSLASNSLTDDGIISILEDDDIDGILDDNDIESILEDLNGNITFDDEARPGSSAACLDKKFQFENQNFTMGEVTLAQLCEKTGWIVNSEKTDKMVASNKELTNIDLTNKNYPEHRFTVYVSVYNTAKESKNMMDCLVSTVHVSCYSTTDKMPSFLIGQIKFGESTIDDVTNAFGEPTNSSTSMSFADISYATNDYEYYVNFSADDTDTPIDSITITWIPMEER